jgi:hypothetical protein
MKMTELNSWFVLAVFPRWLPDHSNEGVCRSHATYYFIAAGKTGCALVSFFVLIRSTGCYISMGDTTKAQELFDTIPSLLDKRKINGKDLPTEILIRKKRTWFSI